MKEILGTGKINHSIWSENDLEELRKKAAEGSIGAKIELAVLEIEDEHDTTSYVAKKVGNNEYVLSGRLDIEKANELFSLDLPESDEYQTIGGLIPIVYFGRANNSLLCLCKARFDGAALLRACTNGSSELMSNISMSIVSMLYNLQLMKVAGEDGVAAYGVLMYVNFIFISSSI